MRSSGKRSFHPSTHILMHHHLQNSLRRAIACAALTVCASVGAFAASVNINYQVDLNSWTVINSESMVSISNGDQVSVAYSFVGGKDLQLVNTSLVAANWLPGWAWLTSRDNDSKFKISDIHVSLLNATVTGSADVEKSSLSEESGQAHLGPYINFQVGGESSVTFSGMQASFQVDTINPYGTNEYYAWFQTYKPKGDGISVNVVDRIESVPDTTVTALLLGSVFGFLIWARRKVS